ncbi:hypothetical protein AB5J72_03765 [Streptomyces sp. CG1]|uniref:hypothetical protein n=1 Tax=Streptomyces sp. CG1 TaxID=1287523 RepID=UPI0034E29D89
MVNAVGRPDEARAEDRLAFALSASPAERTLLHEHAGFCEGRRGKGEEREATERCRDGTPGTAPGDGSGGRS